jgi:hypothetical protein
MLLSRARRQALLQDHVLAVCCLAASILEGIQHPTKKPTRTKADSGTELAHAVAEQTPKNRLVAQAAKLDLSFLPLLHWIVKGMVSSSRKQHGPQPLERSNSENTHR